MMRQLREIHIKLRSNLHEQATGDKSDGKNSYTPRRPGSETSRKQ